MGINLRPGEKEVTLVIHVFEDNEEELIDALNETLNSLAREDVLNDDYDDAWEWRR